MVAPGNATRPDWVPDAAAWLLLAGVGWDKRGLRCSAAGIGAFLHLFAVPEGKRNGKDSIAAKACSVCLCGFDFTADGMAMRVESRRAGQTEETGPSPKHALAPTITPLKRERERERKEGGIGAGM